MNTALLGLGSNIDADQHLKKAAYELRQSFAGIRFSHVYQSAAVGMKGNDFLNACCLMETSLDFDALRTKFKRIEDAHGRIRTDGSWQPRTLDIDILRWNNQTMDENFFQFAHIYVPASDLIRLGKDVHDSEKKATRITMVL